MGTVIITVVVIAALLEFCGGGTSKIILAMWGKE